MTQNPREGLRWFDELTGSAGELPPELAALVARCRGSVLVMAGRREHGLVDYEASLDLYRARGDERGVAGMLYRIGVNMDDSIRARELLEESVALAERTGFRTLAAQAKGALAALDYLDGDVERGLEGLRQSAAAAREIGSVWLEASMTSALAMYSFELGRTSDADRYSREWVDVARRMGDRRHAVQAFATSPRSPRAEATRGMQGCFGAPSRPRRGAERSTSVLV